MGTPLKASSRSDNNETGEQSAARVLLALINVIREINPLKADRIAADYLKEEGGCTIVEKSDGGCAVILNHSDTPKNPCEALAWAIRERIGENTGTSDTGKQNR